MQVSIYPYLQVIVSLFFFIFFHSSIIGAPSAASGFITRNKAELEHSSAERDAAIHYGTSSISLCSYVLWQLIFASRSPCASLSIKHTRTHSQFSKKEFSFFWFVLAANKLSAWWFQSRWSKLTFPRWNVTDVGVDEKNTHTLLLLAVHLLTRKLKLDSVRRLCQNGTVSLGSRFKGFLCKRLRASMLSVIVQLNSAQIYMCT